MNAPILAFIVSFIAMVLIAASYFFKSKREYLTFQALGIVFLISSYFFTGAYFATLGLGVGLARTLTFYGYEKREKHAPISLAVFFSALTLAAYFVVDLWVLGKAKPLDILYLVALVLYAFIFRIRNLKTVRFCALAPTTLSLVYTALNGAALFVILSYAFELGANMVAIYNYDIKGRLTDTKKECAAKESFVK